MNLSNIRNNSQDLNPDSQLLLPLCYTMTVKVNDKVIQERLGLQDDRLPGRGG